MVWLYYYYYIHIPDILLVIKSAFNKVTGKSPYIAMKPATSVFIAATVDVFNALSIMIEPVI